MAADGETRGAVTGPLRRLGIAAIALGIAAIAPGIAAIALGIAVGAGAQAPPPTPSLEALMAGMAGTSGVRAQFREVKRLEMLSEPLESSGTLVFVPPDRLARAVSEPSESRLVIDGDRFFFSDVTRQEAFDLSDNPIAREVVSNFIVLFNGDLVELRRRYEPRFESGDDGWRLELQPRRRPLRDVIDHVTLSGRGRALLRMELVEKGGDRTTTSFDRVETDVAFDDAELERVFGSPATSDRAP